MRFSLKDKRQRAGKCGLAATAVLLVGLASCGMGPRHKAAPMQPSDLEQGAGRYDALCAGCHGIGAVGTQQGPPLVHDLYVPGHHRDSAFRRAISQGVEAHHWPFGNMPPVPDVTPEDAAEIIKYIRALQNSAGLY